MAAKTAASSLNRSLLWIDLGQFPEDPMEVHRCFKKCVRDASLHSSLLYLEEGPMDVLMICNEILQGSKVPWILHSEIKLPGCEFLVLETKAS